MVARLGAEIDTEMEHQTAPDPTTGRRSQRGSGAQMADTIGKEGG